MSDKNYGLATLAVHAGQECPDPATGSRAVPIYQTASYVFKSTEHAANLFALKELGNIYTRMMNPTNDVFERRMAALEGGSGRPGRLLGDGGHLAGPSGHHPSGRRDRLRQQPLRRHVPALPLHLSQAGQNGQIRGLHETRGVREGDHRARPGPSMPRPSATPSWMCPTSRPWPRSPTMPESLWWWTTPSAVGLVRPLDYGADIIAESATKFIDGHGTSIGGVIVDSGKFDWSNGKFPEFTEPDPSYHGLKYWDAFGNFPGHGQCGLRLQGPGAAAAGPRPGAEPLQCLPLPAGPGDSAPAHEEAFRERSAGGESTSKDHPAVAWVNYPGLEDASQPCSGQEVPERRIRRHTRIRHQGRP